MAKPVQDDKHEQELTEEGTGGTPGASSLKTTETHFSRSQLMSNVVQTLADMPHDDLTSFLTKALEVSSKYSDAIPSGRSESNKATLDTHASHASAENVHKALPAVTVVKEDLDTLFGGENGLPEELREKVATLFEAAVSVKLALETAKVEEDFEAKFEVLNETLLDRIDEYLAYAVDEWMDENKIAIESSIHMELVNDFMDKLKEVFTEHYIEIPDDRVDVVAELSKQIEELQGKLDDEVSKRLDVEKLNVAAKASAVFQQVAEGLTATQVEKFKTLTESLDFDGDEESLQEKLTVIREAHFKPANKKPAKGVLSEEVSRTAEEWKQIDGANEAEAKPQTNIDPRIARYLEVVENQAKRGRRGALT